MLKRPVLQEEKETTGKVDMVQLAVVTGAVAIVLLLLFILFRVQKVSVSGNTYVTEQEIRKMVFDDPLSENALYTKLKYKLHRGKVLPCLESASVSFEKPWHLVVQVEEKAPVGYLKVDKQYVCFDKEGLVLFFAEEKPSDIPYVEGIAMTGVKKYEKLESGSASTFELILETSSLLKDNALSADKILFKKGTLSLQFGGVKVILGTEVSANQIMQITPILEKIGSRKGTLHLENYSQNQKSFPFEEKKSDKKKE